MKILICGNGNVTRKGEKLFTHTEMTRFLQECMEPRMTVGYAAVVLDEAREKTKNLANAQIPPEMTVERFRSLSQMNVLGKLVYLPFFAVQLLLTVLRYDIFYCYYPGTLAGMVIRMAQLLHKKYALYVRGELPDTGRVKRDIEGASFIYATGTSIVSRIAPEYSRCFEVAPMSSAFRKERIAEAKSSFHQPVRGLFVGRLERAKGIYELLEALTILKKKNIPVTFNFVGECNPEFADKVRQMELEDCVTLSGLTKNNAELDQHYREADFFCLPTWTEGFPRVLYEAMSYALPCITTMVGGIPSRMVDGENCLAVEAKNVASLTNALTRLLTDPALAVKLSKASCETFLVWKERFAGKTHAGQLKASLDELLK